MPNGVGALMVSPVRSRVQIHLGGADLVIERLRQVTLSPKMNQRTHDRRQQQKGEKAFDPLRFGA